MTIPENILKEFDIAGIQERMDKADWYYEYSDDPWVWNRGQQEISRIRDDLGKLCELDGGREVAHALWKAYVPQYSISKPDFLIVNENRMNENNLAFLEKQLLNLGFGEHMNADMKKNIENERSEFNLQHTFNYGGKDMLADLAFRRGEQNEMYFFNSYRATLKDDPNMSHTFYLNKGNAITCKEAFNLLQGRAVNKDLVNKEGEKYNAWVQLDIKGDKNVDQNFGMERYHTNYGFDLQKTLDQVILKPMSEKERESLERSLEKGNVQSVTFLKEGEEIKGFIEANPKERTVNMYDGHMKPLAKEQKQEFMDQKPAGKELKEEKESKEQKTSARPSDDLEEGQLKKKRERKKGKGVKL